MNFAKFKVRQLQRCVMVQNKEVVLEVKKITSDTYAGSTTYKDEEFILLDIYPKKGGTVKITYSDLTKTITDDGTSEEPNAQRVFFGTFNGVSDSVETPASGTLTIEGKFVAFGVGEYEHEKSAVEYCSCITEIKDFGNVSYIPDFAFIECADLSSVTIPSSVKRIGVNPWRGSFKDKNIIKVDAQNNLFKIDGNCLIETGAKKIIVGGADATIPNGITIIENYAFYGTNLQSVVFPDGVSVIGKYAFYDCRDIKNLTFPSSVISIGNWAFASPMSSVKKEIIMLSKTPPALGESAFGIPQYVNITVPAGCAAVYKETAGWSSYKGYIKEVGA